MIKKVCCFCQEQLEQHIPLKDIKNINFSHERKGNQQTEVHVNQPGTIPTRCLGSWSACVISPAFSLSF